MRLLIIHFLMIACSHWALSQNREIILIVDTIEKNENNPSLDFFKPNVTNTENSLPENIKYELLRSDSHPHYVSQKITITQNSVLTIPTGNKGDIIEILALNKLTTDTLRIEKITYVQNTFPDTTYQTKYWFKLSNDSFIILPKKTKNEIIIRNKSKSKKLTPYYKLTINNIKYNTPLVVTKNPPTILHASGVWPKKPYKPNGKSKKRMKKFSINGETKKWIYKGTLSIQ